MGNGRNDAQTQAVLVADLTVPPQLELCNVCVRLEGIGGIQAYRLGYSEIRDFQRAVFGHHQVIGLDIAMCENAFGSGIVHPVAELGGPHQNYLRQQSRTFQEMREVIAVGSQYRSILHFMRY